MILWRRREREKEEEKKEEEEGKVVVKQRRVDFWYTRVYNIKNKEGQSDKEINSVWKEVWSLLLKQSEPSSDSRVLF